ncbi:uncharacterized protein RAG0_15723 [Rhynchosporium agropyri]|uniref:Uncharacterized protein n=1 Tax=Rhynchosporium agropyri TaxID=914238 RepID=A0A1E1LMD7_9HELO|nr:uncharacterized protein RAG0_15723 [Rhynchosporium agropyri]
MTLPIEQKECDTDDRQRDCKKYIHAGGSFLNQSIFIPKSEAMYANERERKASLHCHAWDGKLKLILTCSKASPRVSPVDEGDLNPRRSSSRRYTGEAANGISYNNASSSSQIYEHEITSFSTHEAAYDQHVLINSTIWRIIWLLSDYSSISVNV